MCIFVTPHRSRIFELTPTFSKNTVKVLWLLFFYMCIISGISSLKAHQKKIIYRGSTHSAVWFYSVNEPKPNCARRKSYSYCNYIDSQSVILKFFWSHFPHYDRTLCISLCMIFFLIKNQVLHALPTKL